MRGGEAALVRRDEVHPGWKAGTLGSKEAEGGTLGGCDLQQKPAKEPGNQKFVRSEGPET